MRDTLRAYLDVVRPPHVCPPCPPPAPRVPVTVAELQQIPEWAPNKLGAPKLAGQGWLFETRMKTLSALILTALLALSARADVLTVRLAAPTRCSCRSCPRARAVDFHHTEPGGTVGIVIGENESTSPRTGMVQVLIKNLSSSSRSCTSAGALGLRGRLVRREPCRRLCNSG